MESIPSQTRLTGLLRAFVEWAYLGDYQGISDQQGCGA